jgi:hypothetical protein
MSLLDEIEKFVVGGKSHGTIGNLFFILVGIFFFSIIAAFIVT